MKKSQQIDDALSTSSFDDPVPPGSEDSVVTGSSDPSHSIAADVTRVLHRLPGVIVDRVAVRELPNGAVLLEGSVQMNATANSDLAGQIREKLSVPDVVDRLRVQRTSALDETTFEPPSADRPLKG